MPAFRNSLIREAENTLSIRSVSHFIFTLLSITQMVKKNPNSLSVHGAVNEGYENDMEYT